MNDDEKQKVTEILAEGQQEQIAIRKQIENITAQVDKEIAEQSQNIYFIIRAVSLGSLGAFAALLATYARTPEKHLLDDPGRVAASIVTGGIVAIVAFGLFFTKQVSVFPNPEASLEKVPDFWRMTILCLISGAFADRLFTAASSRVDVYLGQKAATKGATARANGVPKRPSQGRNNKAKKDAPTPDISPPAAAEPLPAGE